MARQKSWNTSPKGINDRSLNFQIVAFHRVSKTAQSCNPVRESEGFFAAKMQNRLALTDKHGFKQVKIGRDKLTLAPAVHQETSEVSKE